jgi:hypothetical protein
MADTVNGSSDYGRYNRLLSITTGHLAIASDAALYSRVPNPYNPAFFRAGV